MSFYQMPVQIFFNLFFSTLPYVSNDQSATM